VQVHRSVIVNLGSVSHVTRGLNETATIHLKAAPKPCREPRLRAPVPADVGVEAASASCQRGATSPSVRQVT